MRIVFFGSSHGVPEPNRKCTSVMVEVDGDHRYIIDMGREHFISCAMPIISEGDVIGCVVSASQSGAMDGDKISSDVEIKLIQTAAIFLGKQMES